MIGLKFLHARLHCCLLLVNENSVASIMIGLKILHTRLHRCLLLVNKNSVACLLCSFFALQSDYAMDIYRSLNTTEEPPAGEKR